MNLPKGLFLVGFADAVGSGIAAIFWFYLANLLLPEEYGEIFYFLGIAGIASYFALFGTQNTIIVYAAKNIKLQSTFYVISLGVGAIGMFIAFIILNRIDVGLLIFGYIINTLATGELLGRKSYESYVKYILIQKGLTFVLGIGFYNLFGVDGIIYALTLTYIAFTIIIYKGFKNSKVDFVLLKNKIGFVTNNYLMNITGAFNGQIDKLVIGPLLGFAILGNYSLALQVVMILFIIPGIVYKYTLTHDASGEQNRQIKKIHSINFYRTCNCGNGFCAFNHSFVFSKI